MASIIMPAITRATTPEDDAMPTPVTGVTGPSGERSVASADIIAEARQRQADRLRAAQTRPED